MLTKTITLTNASDGIWTDECGSVVASGVTIPANEDFWQVARALQPKIESLFAGTGTGDVYIKCVNPEGTDIMGNRVEGGEAVCWFEVRDGQVSAQV